MMARWTEADRIRGRAIGVSLEPPLQDVLLAQLAEANHHMQEECAAVYRDRKRKLAAARLWRFAALASWALIIWWCR